MNTIKQQFEKAFENKGFKSDIIANHWCSVRSSIARHLFQWKSIESEDLRELLPNDALLLARNRKENSIILWFNDDLDCKNQFIAITDGTNILSQAFTTKRSDMIYGISVSKIAKKSTVAYLLINPEKYSHISIQRKRRETGNILQQLKQDVETINELERSCLTILSGLSNNELDIKIRLRDTFTYYKNNILKVIEELKNTDELTYLYPIYSRFFEELRVCVISMLCIAEHPDTSGIANKCNIQHLHDQIVRICNNIKATILIS